MGCVEHSHFWGPILLNKPQIISTTILKGETQVLFFCFPRVSCYTWITDLLGKNRTEQWEGILCLSHRCFRTSSQCWFGRWKALKNKRLPNPLFQWPTSLIHEEVLSCSMKSMLSEAGLRAKHAQHAWNGEDRRKADPGWDPLGTEDCVLGKTQREQAFCRTKENTFPLPSHHHSKAESKTDFSNLF